jgi:hypothetical protein
MYSCSIDAVVENFQWDTFKPSWRQNKRIGLLKRPMVTSQVISFGGRRKGREVKINRNHERFQAAMRIDAQCEVELHERTTTSNIQSASPKTQQQLTTNTP